jgi:predicted nucleic acid-binding protein
MSRILLDTSYLIKALVPDSAEANRLRGWLDRGAELISSSVSWYEFLCGPVDAQGRELMELILQDRIVPFTDAQAREAARLFNSVGRKRSLRVDAMIAAAALTQNAALATDNTRDFSPFAELGLELV